MTIGPMGPPPISLLRKSLVQRKQVAIANARLRKDVHVMAIVQV